MRYKKHTSRYCVFHKFLDARRNCSVIAAIYFTIQNETVNRLIPGHLNLTYESRISYHAWPYPLLAPAICNLNLARVIIPLNFLLDKGCNISHSTKVEIILELSNI